MIGDQMTRAEHYAKPIHGHLGGYFERVNDFSDIFHIRWGKIDFDVSYGVQANVKVVLKVYREQGSCETYLIDTDAYDIQWDRHKRKTRDFYILPFSNHFGPITCVKFAYLIHLNEHSVASEFDYLFMDSLQVQDGHDQNHFISTESTTLNHYRSYELNAVELQCDADWYNQHFDDLKLTPKFTKGQQFHPYHPKRYIHDHIDKVIQSHRQNPLRLCTIKVSVDCIDDTDFINHLIHASHEEIGRAHV